MKNSSKAKILKLKSEIKRLKEENAKRNSFGLKKDDKPKVKAPETFAPIFKKAEETVGEYFKTLKFTPSKGTIEINEERYVLVRASALSYDFLNSFKKLYADRGEDEAINIAKNILFDIAHVIGLEDARNFHKKMKLKDPISKLSAGPIHFAYSGWAFVDILPESKPSPDENYFLKYNHPFSFEADSWVRAGKKSKVPVCIMNSGYSSGWCEESFGIPLTAVEITCRAKGDKHCTFIMAPPNKIDKYLKLDKKKQADLSVTIPAFLERKTIEEKIKASLFEKEVLIKEVHHRVKNNLQIVSSLLSLQAESIIDKQAKDKYLESIGRIRSMAIIHEQLYRSKNLSKIKAEEYFSELVRFISETYNVNKNVKANLKIKVKDKFIDIDKAIPCGIIINELLSNAFKYAFPDNRSGEVNIELRSIVNPNYKNRLIVSDNGIGIKGKINFHNPDTLGLQLINSLTEQLDGKLEVKKDKGTSFTFFF
ncbi:MAG TPA: histidine kinase dimerization/phosphoacceptor domain -containing protein [Bacteroidia bacterium]|jgi:two-component sensor histidine kinase|nr:histidine kinase dimerization/phosphoacceptor domain -containing protein [Bacteroidia bacterium]